MNKQLKRIKCQCCGRVFEICRRCYRRQVYCSEKCRRSGYIERHRIAQRKYQKSLKGKNKRNEAGKRRRKGRKKYTGALRHILQTCRELIIIKQNIMKNSGNKRGKCIKCGEIGDIVNEFPKRSYGKEKKMKVAYF